MILSDGTLSLLVGEEDSPTTITIRPYDRRLIQPASIDFRLGELFRWGWSEVIDTLDAKTLAPSMSEWVALGQPFTINPGQCVLATTLEYIKVPDNMVATVCGKSGLARIFLSVHATAGHVDPGFEGYVTLELVNSNSVPIILYPGQRIGQFKFEMLDSKADCPYGHVKLGSHYQHQGGAQPSLYGTNYQ